MTPTNEHNALLVKFLEGTEEHPLFPWTHAGILSLGDADWELAHNIIQWMFPLTTPSLSQPSTPWLTKDQSVKLSLAAQFRARMRASGKRYNSFLVNNVCWRGAHNHNHLRITRAIASLSMHGCRREGLSLYDTALALQVDATKDTLGYWKSALGANP